MPHGLTAQCTVWPAWTCATLLAERYSTTEVTPAPDGDVHVAVVDPGGESAVDLEGVCADCRPVGWPACAAVRRRMGTTGCGRNPRGPGLAAALCGDRFAGPGARLQTARNRTRIPGFRSAVRGRFTSHTGASVRLMSCQPPGDSRGQMPLNSPASATDPPGTRVGFTFARHPAGDGRRSDMRSRVRIRSRRRSVVAVWAPMTDWTSRPVGERPTRRGRRRRRRHR